MNLDQIETKCFILALFIRDDGERFLLGSRMFEFLDSQLHFSGNSYQNDIVEVQGNDGVMLAGQVRRGTSQSFDGYIGDSSVERHVIEQNRRAFFKFFRKNHYYKVVYIFTDGTAIQRRQGFIVEAPEVKELYQLFPKYHISMNFEDINYYNYEEDSEGEEIYGESATLKIATAATGGLIWEEGTQTTVSGEGSNFTLNDTIAGGEISDLQLKGDTTQQTYSGKNLYNFTDTHDVSDGVTVDSDGWITITYDNSGGSSTVYKNYYTNPIPQLVANTQYDIFLEVKSVTGNAKLNLVDNASGSQFQNDVIFQFADLSDNTTYKASSTTKTDLSGRTVSIRTFGQYTAGKSGTITFRITVAEHSDTTAQDFIYEPYVGGIPAPNPDYPQTVNTVTGRQVVTISDDDSQSQEYEVNLGKNLFDMDATENGGIGPDGNNAAAADNWRTTGYIEAQPNTTYTYSMNGNITGSFYFLRFYQYDKNHNFISPRAESGNPSLTVTTSSNTRYIRLSFYSNVGTMTESMARDAKLQLELGSTATTYAPYISHFGKNMFDKFSATASSSDYSLNANGNITTTANNYDTGRRWMSLDTFAAGVYTLSFLPFLVGATDRNMRVSVRITSTNETIYDETFYNIVNGELKYANFTLSESAAIGICLIPSGPPPSGANIYFSGVQIELGSTATSYEPFIGGQLELCKIGDYQDYIYKSGNDWYLHKEIKGVDLATFSWGDWVRNMCRTADITDIKYVSSNTQLGTGLATNYIMSIGSGMSGNDRFGRIAIDVDRVAVNTGSTSITPTGLFYYALATPTDTQITNTALVAQLNALAGATTYDGQTVFTVTSPYQLGILSLTATIISEGGVVWDNYGAEWEEGTGGGPTMIDVESIDNVYPVWELTGPAINPQISVLTTNTTLAYTGTITASQTLKIDMFNKTATLNGVSVVGNVSGDWVYLNPGVNRITYTTNNADAPDSTLWWQEIVG